MHQRLHHSDNLPGEWTVDVGVKHAQIIVASLIFQQILKEEVIDMLDGLTARERRVIELRYGLEDGYNRTLAELGDELGVSRERVRQIEAEALTKLRASKETGRLKEYLD